MRSGQQHGRSSLINERYCFSMSHETLWNHPHLHSEAEIDERLDDLDHRLAKVNLVNRALWEILRHHSNLREDELLAKVAEIDLRDVSVRVQSRARRGNPGLAEIYVRGNRELPEAGQRWSVCLLRRS